MKLTIIANDLNDHDEMRKTLLSILQTAPGKEIEVIVVDDCSQIPLTVEEEGWEQLAAENQTLIILRPDHRLGCGGSRHYAAEKATGDFLLFIDCHMRFTKGWYEAAEARIVDRPSTVHCACCVGLSEAQMDPENTNGGFYTGATINVLGPDRNSRRVPQEIQVFEGVWKDHTDPAGHTENPPQKRPLKDVEIPCVMGACYFVPREFFFKVGGLTGLQEWGSDEPLLSIKTWLAGGEVRLLDTVRLGHKFKDRQPYSVDFAKVLYNKIRMLMTCLSEKESVYLTAVIGATSTHTPRALAEIARDRDIIKAERDYLRGIFVHDLKWFCDKFTIPYPAIPA